MFGAQAEATIYGVGDVAYTKWTTTTADFGSATATGLKGTQMGGSAIGFKASEDLGNGLKAEFNYELGVLTDDNYGTGGSDNDDANGDGQNRFQPNTDLTGSENRQAWIGLSGSFGSIKAGRMYSLLFNNSAAVDPGGVTGVPGYLPSNVMSARQSNSIQYTAPTLIAGVNLSLSKVFGECGSGDLAALKANACAIANAGDVTGYSVSYANGGLFAGYASETAVGGGINIAAEGTGINDVTDGIEGTNKKTDSLSLSYDFGMAKVIYATMNAAVGTTKLKSQAYGLSAPVLGGSFFMTSSSGSVDDTGNNFVGGDNTIQMETQDITGRQVGFNYPMSKRTVVYLHNGQLKLSAYAGGTTLKATSFGVHHSF